MTTADLLFTEAHTAYAFTDEPVSDEQLREVYELVKFAPTPMNAHPLRVTYVRSPEAKARLIPLLSKGNQPKTESAPVAAILAADTNFHEHLGRVFPQSPNAKDMFKTEEAREKFARFAATIQVGYFIVAARLLGLDAGPMSGIDAPGIDAEFHAGTGLKTLCVVNLGHVAEGGTNPRNPRLAYEEAVTTL